MIILDTVGDSIQAETDNANSLTVTAYGIETVSGVNNYKRLGQVQLTGGSVDNIYTVPSSTSTICTLLVVTNVTNSPQTISLWNVPNGSSPSDSNVIFKNTTISANNSLVWHNGTINFALGTSMVETDPVVGAVNGIVKADGSGHISAATNTDAEIADAVSKANSALQNVVDDTAPKAGGEFDFQLHSAGFTEQSITSSSGAATIDWTKGNKAAITLTENVTFTFTNPSNVCNLLLRITNDATGGYNLTFPSSVVWLVTEPTWTDGGANKTIIMSAYFDGTTYWAQATPWQQ